MWGRAALKRQSSHKWRERHTSEFQLGKYLKSRNPIAVSKKCFFGCKSRTRGTGSVQFFNNCNVLFVVKKANFLRKMNSIGIFDTFSVVTYVNTTRCHTNRDI